MFNQSENEFYTWFIFKVDALSQNVLFSLDISAIVFNNLIPDVRELLIPEGIQVPPRTPTETNHQGNQRIILARNVVAEAEKKIIAIKSVQPARESHNTSIFMVMIGGNP